MSNKMQRHTVYFIWKLLYMFRMVPPPIIRSANNCIYTIWYLSHRYCYLPLETALHVSAGTTTHHQECKQLSTASGICHTFTATCRCKLLCMFRVIPSSIFKSANICIYSIWYLSHRYCYLRL
jgi:hypothetical protein